MRYLVLLYGDETQSPAEGTPEWDALLAGYSAFDELAGEAIVAGEALHDNASCRTIRHDGAAVRITAGPFAETVEGLGGFYVLDAPTLDDLVEVVCNIPAANDGGIEVRPMVEWVDRGPRPIADGEVRYLATIHGTETAAEEPGTPGWEGGAAEHGRFGEMAGDALRAAGAVHPTGTASTVRVRNGEVLVSDGPYAEAMEVVGGFYVLQGDAAGVADLATGIPVPEDGAVELRPIMELDG
jgi:hypothetical protein